MTTTELLCPDCDSPMELGFIPDWSYGKVMQAGWHRGMPETQTFFGLEVSRGAVKHDRTETLGVIAFRCTNCGLLRLYAME